MPTFNQFNKQNNKTCIQPFHSSVCSLPNMTTLGDPPPRPAELAFHVHVTNVPTAKKALTSQNMDGE